MIMAFFVVGLGLVLLYALARFVYEKVGDREEIARQWKNPRIRRWWVLNGILFAVAIPLLILVRETDLLIKGDQNSGIRMAVFLGLFVTLRMLARELGIDKKDRPAELPPTSPAFPGLRKNLSAVGRREIQAERLRSRKGRSLWWVYVGLGLLLVAALVSPQCSSGG